MKTSENKKTQKNNYIFAFICIICSFIFLSAFLALLGKQFQPRYSYKSSCRKFAGDNLYGSQCPFCQRKCRQCSGFRCAAIRSDRKCRQSVLLRQLPNASAQYRRQCRFWFFLPVRKSLSNSVEQAKLFPIYCFAKLFPLI